MKNFLLLFISLLSFFFLSAQKAEGKKIYLSKSGDNGCLFSGANACQPGDTLVLKASLNPWSYVYLGGIQGHPGKPVVIINEGPVVLSSGFDLEHCQYIKLSGSGSKDKYGFSIEKSGGTALTIHGRSAHIEAERFSATECSFGCWIKNEANCDSTINNWVLNDISVHDFMMRDIRIEGFYMGSTDPNNFSRPISCNGEQKFYKPSQLGNIKIYNGTIDGTGRPAIMLSNARVGISEIYNNKISNVGREYNDQQGTGISIGGYTHAYVHDNVIKNTFTWGIASLGGSGMVRIENNKVDSSGYLDGKSLNWPQNILIDTRPTQPADSTQFIIRNNQLSNPGRDVKNIEVWESHKTYKGDNIICNNTVHGKPASIGVAPGVRWRNCQGLAQSNKTNNQTGSIILFVTAGSLLLVSGIFLYKKRKGLLKRKVRTFSVS